MGHEFCGRIKRVPEGSKLSCGQPVMVDPRLYCGSCHICTETRDTNGCPKYGFLGLSGGGGGGLSSVVAVQESMCHPLPDEASLETAAICEPMAVGWHAVRSTEIKDFANKSCLILGGGPIGIAVIYSLKANGAKAKDIIVSEPTKERREHNLKLTENVIDPITGKILDKCMELTGGKGVDVVFDCAGVASGLFDGVMALRHKGVYMNIAGWGTPVSWSQQGLGIDCPF